MGVSYTTTGIALSLKTGTASGNFRVVDGEGGTVLRTDLSIVDVVGLNVGTPGASASGAIKVYDSGNKFFDLNVDDGLVMSTGFPVVLQGTAAHGTVTGLGTNQAVLYVDVSGGKHRLMVQFATGVPQAIATEP